MAQRYTVKANSIAARQLAAIHLKYRQLGYPHLVAFADDRIEHALELNPQGGMPSKSGKWWSVTVRPLRAFYTIQASEVWIIKYEEAPGQLRPKP
jgi:hypothetical protein